MLRRGKLSECAMVFKAGSRGLESFSLHGRQKWFPVEQPETKDVSLPSVIKVRDKWYKKSREN